MKEGARALQEHFRLADKETMVNAKQSRLIKGRT